MGGGHRANGTSQTGVDQGAKQVQVIQAGCADGQRDGQGRHHRAGGVGDRVWRESGAMLVEDVGDTEGVGCVGDQEGARVGAYGTVGGDIDDRVGSLHLEGDPVLVQISA